MMPIVTKRRHVDQETGQMVEGLCSMFPPIIHYLTISTDWEMVFADDEREANPTSFKFLQMAHAWKNAQSAGGGALSGFTAAAAASATTKQATDDDQEMDNASDVASSQGGDD